jgi:outer membrane lipoprotein-sorting protein
MLRLSGYLLMAALLVPGDPASTHLVKLMEARYRSAKTMEATFLERYEENGRLVRTESGTAYFRRPGKMRWEYEVPEKNLFVVDGKTAWFYVPGDHTVTRVPAKQSTDFRTPLALLAGEMKVSRVCGHIEVARDEKPQSEDDVVFSCSIRGGEESQPRSSSGGKATGGGSEAHDTAFFEIVRNSGELVRLLVRQSGGVQVEFRFRNWLFDPPMPESLFHFQAPPGVAIVNGELPAE